MKTLADLKRRMIPGITINCVHLVSGWTPGPRTLAHVDTVKFGLKMPDTDRVSYCDWPKAKDLEIVDDNTFIVHAPWYIDGEEKLVPLLKYTIIN